MNTKFRKNLKDVATACKNYTDQEIAKSEERMKWYVGEYTTSTSDDNTTASTKTVPSNATRCKIKRIYGLTQKFNPTTAYDDTSYMVKTMPATVYDFDVSKVEGKSEVSKNKAPTPTWAGGYHTSSGGYFGNYDRGITDRTDNYVKPSTKYTLSFNLLLGSSTIADRSNFITEYASDRTFVKRTTLAFSTTSVNGLNVGTFTTQATTAYIKFSIYTSAITGDYTAFFDGCITNVMLNEGSTALPYSPYFDDIHNLELSGLKVEGANLCQTPTYNGVMNNTVAKSIDFGNLPSGTYSISLNVSANADNRTFVIYYYNNGSGVGNIVSNLTGTGAKTYTFTLDNSIAYDDIRLGINTQSNDYSITLDSLMLNRGSTALAYVPYIAPTTKTIDLSTILYNGSPLFEGNSLKGVGNVADEITPYKAIKRFGIVDLGSLTWYKATNRIATTSLSTVIKAVATNWIYAKILCAKYTTDNFNNIYTNTNDKTIGVRSESQEISIWDSYWYNNWNETDFKNSLSGVYLVYELATPIEVSIDWSATLRNIQGYSNGTITLQNTYNMDTANLITYNSIIKENCCAKIVQSRGGDVVATVNFPTTASDGYSAGSVNNYRDFTTNKRIGNVSKSNDMSDYFYDFVESNNRNIFRTNGFDVKAQTSTLTTINALSRIYNATTQQATWVNYDMAYHDGTGTKKIAFVNNNYKDTTTFTTAMANEPLYYENDKTDEQKTTDITPLDTNILVVEPGDILAFFDSNDNPVTVPSDLTYRIEVAK